MSWIILFGIFSSIAVVSYDIMFYIDFDAINSLNITLFKVIIVHYQQFTAKTNTK